MPYLNLSVFFNNPLLTDIKIAFYHSRNIIHIHFRIKARAKRITISFRARTALSSRTALIYSQISAQLDASHLKQCAEISYSGSVFAKCCRLIAPGYSYTFYTYVFTTGNNMVRI